MSNATLTMNDITILPLQAAADKDLTSSPVEPRLAAIRGIESEIEAHVVVAALHDHGLFCELQSHVETAHSHLFVPQRSWGSVLVRLDQAERALELINAARGPTQIPADDFPDELREDQDE